VPRRAADHRRISPIIHLIPWAWAEVAWDFSRAVDPATGLAVHVDDLRATPAMVRSLASSFGGAYSTMLALLLTFISLATRSRPVCTRPS
jgi:hypothetical protein